MPDAVASLYGVTVLFTLIGVTRLLANCTQGQFLNRTVKQCAPCTVCKPNEITVKKCVDQLDALCVSLYDLLHNTREDKIDVDHVPQSVPTYNASKELLQTEVEESQKDATYWQNLAFMCLGIVLFLVSMVSLGLVYFWYRRREKSSSKFIATEKQGQELEIPAMQSFDRFLWPHNDYAGLPNYDRPLSHSRMRRNQRRFSWYSPKRRIVETHEDDVFESASEASGVLANRISKLSTLSDLSIPQSEVATNRPISAVYLDVLHITEPNSLQSSRLSVNWQGVPNALTTSIHTGASERRVAGDSPTSIQSVKTPLISSNLQASVDDGIETQDLSDSLKSIPPLGDIGTTSDSDNSSKSNPGSVDSLLAINESETHPNCDESASYIDFNSLSAEKLTNHMDIHRERDSLIASAISL